MTDVAPISGDHAVGPRPGTRTATVRGLSVAAPGGGLVLDGVDLDLPPATVTALLGESGAGKTTLAQALLGHLGPGLRRVAGQVDVAGHDPFTTAGRTAVRGCRSAYLPQDPASALDPRRRVLAQLTTAARIAYPRDDRAARTARVHAAVRAAALEPVLLTRHPAQLSGGQAQRALLAWTFVTRPALLILDEPTSGLDPTTAARVHAAVTALPWAPAVLIISHDRGLVGDAADQVVELEKGRRRPAPVRAVVRAVAEPVAHPASDVALTAEGLVIARGGRRLLDGARFTVGRGELVAVQGVSGSGKTSLARALCGFAPPTGGTLRVDGVELSWEAEVRARRRQPFVAYVGQDARAALNPHETVARTLDRAVAAAVRSGRGGRSPTDIPRLLTAFALPHDVLHRTPDRLSGGQRHRLALARALAAAPHVLICDETTAALDPATTSLVLDALQAWRADSGAPTIFLTHADRVAARAGRVLTLTGGGLQ